MTFHNPLLDTDDYTIQYKPDKEMVQANHVSCFSFLINSLPIPIMQKTQHVQLSHAELDLTWGSIECNLVYSIVYHLTLRGWPEHIQQVPHITRPFWDTWDELSVDSGLLLKETRVCIPPRVIWPYPCWLPWHPSRDWQDVSPGKRGSVLARHRCWHCQLCPLVHNMHQAQSLPPAQPMLPRDFPDGPW